MKGDTITAFMGRKEIGFPKEIEKPRLVQRRGADMAPPKHWMQEQIEDQEERDLVLHSMAPGTWVSYTRWWQLFVTFVKIKGVHTSDWRTSSTGDRMIMVMMLQKMVVSMRQKYAYGTINMLVTAVLNEGSKGLRVGVTKGGGEVRSSDGGTKAHQGSVSQEEAGTSYDS